MQTTTTPQADDAARESAAKYIICTMKCGMYPRAGFLIRLFSMDSARENQAIKNCQMPVKRIKWKLSQLQSRVRTQQARLQKLPACSPVDLDIVLFVLKNGCRSYHLNAPKTGPILFFLIKDWINMVDNCRIKMILLS